MLLFLFYGQRNLFAFVHGLSKCILTRVQPADQIVFISKAKKSNSPIMLVYSSNINSLFRIFRHGTVQIVIHQLGFNFTERLTGDSQTEISPPRMPFAVLPVCGFVCVCECVSLSLNPRVFTAPYISVRSTDISLPLKQQHRSASAWNNSAL